MFASCIDIKKIKSYARSLDGVTFLCYNLGAFCETTAGLNNVTRQTVVGHCLGRAGNAN
jgi:hypothetical protein